MWPTMLELYSVVPYFDKNLCVGMWSLLGHVYTMTNAHKGEKWRISHGHTHGLEPWQKEIPTIF